MSRFRLTFLSIILYVFTVHETLAQETNGKHVWTFTYLKAVAHHKDELKEYIEKNWFAMDQAARQQGLIGRYELIGNKATDGDWDLIVAVEYLTPNGYDDIADRFEAIRKEHQVVLVNGLGMKDLGRIVRSETVARKEYE